MVKVALLARLVAKAGKEEEVAAFLSGALPLAQGEPATIVWFAIRLSKSEFGIFDAFPDDAGRVMCAQTMCTYDGEGRNVGYVVPTMEETTAPVALHLAGVVRGAATRARLILAADYPWFMWANMFPPPTHLDLRFRINGGAWHDRFITDVEANAFMDFFPALGGAGASAGLLNQAIDVDLNELRDGDNLVELQSAGTWTGSYRVSVTGVDLVLNDQ